MEPCGIFPLFALLVRDQCRAAKVKPLGNGMQTVASSIRETYRQPVAGQTGFLAMVLPGQYWGRIRLPRARTRVL